MGDKSQPDNKLVSHAQLEWRDNGQPVSSAFDDIYFSTASGLEETRHVFLAQNHLPGRWAALKENAVFTIGETGFGTGLNFLAAWQLWSDIAPASAHLHFVSVEKFPLHPKDLARALSMWPELESLSRQLIAQYPPYLAPGVHRINLSPNVHLTLVVGEASDAFRSLSLDDAVRDRWVDAWFLDGFAPSKNPEMWSEALFQSIAALSAPDSTFATFTCAGIVKRGLKSTGFALEKVPGFGRKREMLRGSFADADKTTSDSTTSTPPTYLSTPWHLPPDLGTARKPKTVAIIGAGIAGASAACALAARNYQVTVFEQGEHPGSGASGNDQGILYAKLSPKPGPNGDFNLQALQFAQRYYPSQCPQAAHFDGLLQLAQTEKEQQLQQQICQQLQLEPESLLARPVSAEQASEHAGVPLQFPGLYFPHAGWLRPRQVCEALLQHPNIQTHFHTRISDAVYEESSDGKAYWTLHIDGVEQAQSFDALILCTANFNRQFSQTAPLPLQPIRGQVTFAEATTTSEKLKIALCGEGYIAPSGIRFEREATAQHSFGATFKLKQSATEIRQEEHQENLATLASLLPEFAQEFSSQTLRGRAALRAATPDYLPMAGPVAQWEELENTYGALRKNRKQLIGKRTPYQANLYVLAGLGSRGFTYAPLAAEVLAAWINREAMPVSEDLVKALHPMRFAIRALGKNREI
ncbi:bifunctional tRNA (5-methylaminomethyl-2-thiouridine)(34)-methyltransferase MnmD/FAD-dependent 5-carboxymethylaminomethyl-2-thiouridine(34) oxidoreductase MnmC [Microbulbifer agarilyticus]|uniref:bifunctional tRNA (5-methylaminomethyl-2-thiouridine)(34)-methyltransferase MnmD/FAD-dependent 5-carboxymethylaminomethyl-2-thiouridine(34) oxidoreductase MnmC n=1 Tax=Microbulbifer agarilyticus TaxID=260552 RepID=UPI001CD77A51|nr:bifunctional tRNA (5-methylaminomethyl-2-thiouridine)(34)-methyltransferase MnmD/FAD-dependent 5-carboxymethylaminomethyl-2-thiouridine(34) oxidoreductase MnmC [Microbulbifer agarilyticus]MCA0901239.1 bifunctional tRNA (5-methylaminomethyl-2-thiouridine)(34)-methyltransferase MnmD/FAD-dependent 5-carboxymethylaminomethyl-2-thiouridine(34) oxidoreductase MnmC [Microbulbifer agarilyticus]